MADAETHMTDCSQETCVKFKYTTFETNFIVQDNKTHDNISLQEAFRRYKEAKQDELRQARLLRKRQELRKADPEKMATLRQKFLNQAKKYYGYPYARKYWPPDSPEYKSKLFLDCCGLVRRVMRDLAEDFGFIIGPWNQAYMFDTLPIVVQNEKDMKPGDLVFISATYYNPKSKKQRHNMTHVEIWAGEGCKTIGARWNNGKVQTWDSYKFLAKSYHSETYHFRSIDTWLKGICTSHCSQHFWRRSKYSPTKKSVFALPEQIDEDEAAGDDDDNVDTFNMRGNTFISQVASVNKMVAHCKISEAERPKTELDSPFVSDDSSCPRQKVIVSKTEFPTIRNDLKGNGKNILNKRKKMKCVAGNRQKGSSSLVDRENRGQEGSCDSNTDSTGAENNLSDRKKEHGKLTISGSLNDLGRKGLYLRDLVDSQKADHNVEDIEGDPDEGSTGEEALEDPEEDDYDDDYFIFVNNDEDSDREENAKSEHSDDSSEFIMGEAVESDNEKDTEGEPAITHEAEDDLVECHKGSLVENTAMYNISEEGDDIEVSKKAVLVNKKQAVPSCDKDGLEESCADDTEEGMTIQTNANAFDIIQNLNEDSESFDQEKTCNISNDEEKTLVKVNIIENVIPFGPTENVKSPNLRQNSSHENCNQNANPKVTEKRQPKERTRGQCLKASVITVVSQSGPSVSQPSSKPSSVWSSSSQASVTSQPEVSGSLASFTSQPEVSNSQASSSQPEACGSQGCSVSPFILPVESKTSEPLTKVDPLSNHSTENLEDSKSSTGIEVDSPSDTQNENDRTESGKKAGEKKSPTGARMTKLPSCSLQTNMTPMFYIGGGNGVSLVEGPLTGLGWKRITDKYDERFKLKWAESKARINYSTFREGDQLVNHLPNSQLLTNKLGLLNSLKEYERVTLSTKGRLPRLRMSDFHPETYKLDEKADRELFLDVYKDDEIWICKPAGLNQGKGISLIRNREAIYEVLDEGEQKKRPQKAVMSRIVQRYITNPLLLEGRKFDIRAYMLVASTAPFLILYHKGYVRLCCHKYDADNTDLGRHLTNQFVQKKNPNYEKLKESTAWSMDKFNEYINEKVRPDCPVDIEVDWVYHTFTKQVQKIIIHCFNSVKHKLQSRIGFFDLYGLDFMVDTNMKVQLIEINTNPCLCCNCKALKEVIPGVVEEALYLSIECFEKSRKNLPLMPLQSLKNFTVLYCGSRPNTNNSRQSRSVPPMKDNSNTEKPKLLSNRQGQRVSTQITPLYSSNRWRVAEKTESESNSSTTDKESITNSRNVQAAPLRRGKTDTNLKLPIVKETKRGENIVAADGEDIEGNAEKKPLENDPKQEKNNPEVNDTLTKSADIPLNKVALSAGQLKQSGHKQTLLNEVQLKMTHAENSNSATKPTSAQSLRAREMLERGN